jgi:hypothetical protein
MLAAQAANFLKGWQPIGRNLLEILFDGLGFALHGWAIGNLLFDTPLGR